MTQPAPPASGLVRGLALVLLAAVFLRANMLPVASLDSWADWKYGQWIWDHRQLPSHEPFSSYSDPKTPVRDWRLHPRFSELSFLHLGVAKILDSLGLESLARQFGSAGVMQAIEELNLDGLLALWHPSAGN